MSQNFQQHHFNAIMNYAIEYYTYKQLLQVQNSIDDQKQTNITMRQVRTDLATNMGIPIDFSKSDELNKKCHEATFGETLEVRRHLKKAEMDLKNYLNIAVEVKAGENSRQMILTIIQRSIEESPAIIFPKDGFTINDRNICIELINDAITPSTQSDQNNATNLSTEYPAYFPKRPKFADNLMGKLNTAFGNHNYDYTKPESNYFIISFLAHPLVRGISSVALIGGLATMAIGILAATGLVTGLPMTAVVAMIAGGGVAGTSCSSMMIASFFRHRTPEEKAIRDKIEVPDLAEFPHDGTDSEEPPPEGPSSRMTLMGQG